MKVLITFKFKNKMLRYNFTLNDTKGGKTYFDYCSVIKFKNGYKPVFAQVFNDDDKKIFSERLYINQAVLDDRYTHFIYGITFCDKIVSEVVYARADKSNHIKLPTCYHRFNSKNSLVKNPDNIYSNVRRILT